MCDLVVSQLVTSNELQNAIISKVGVPLAAGVIKFFRQQDQTTLKNVYFQKIVGGNVEYVAAPNPMTLSASGSTVDVNGDDILLYYYPYLDQTFPIEMCDPNKVDYYYIEVYDSNGQLQFTREFFPFLPIIPGPEPSNAVNTNVNYIINNRFWRNLSEQYTASGTIDLSTLTQYSAFQYNNDGINTYYYKTLAPSQHDGFSMPDFNYIRNANSNVTETANFIQFPTNTTPTILDDIQPEWYLNHICTADTSGATWKVYQFPISLHQSTLANQTFTFTIQGQWLSGTQTVNIYLYQFCGTGAVSPSSLLTPLGTITFTNTWTKHYLTGLTFPPVSSSVNAVGDDAWYIQIGMPVGSGTLAQCSLNFCLPSIYLSDTQDNVPNNEFQTYDQIDSIIAAPRTGDIKTTLNTFSPFGWVPLNGGTIATNIALTAPTGNKITYSGVDAWPLYSMIWNSFKTYTNGTTNYIAQLYDTTGSVISYGSNAYSDFIAGNQMALTNMLGRVLTGTVPLSYMPQQLTTTFTVAQTGVTFTASQGSSNPWLLLTTSATSVCFGEVIRVSNSGGALPVNLVAATDYYCIPSTSNGLNFWVATSLANAQNGVYILWASNGTGTQTMTPQSLVGTAANALTANGITAYRGCSIVFSTTGTLPGNIQTYDVFYLVPCVGSTTTFCLATSFSNAMAGTLIAYSSAGTGIQTLILSLSGTSTGEFSHLQLGSELGSLSQQVRYAATAGGAYETFYDGSGTGTASGSYISSTFTTFSGTKPALVSNAVTYNKGNVMQPSTNFNMFIKL